MFDGIPLYTLQFAVLKYLDLIGIVLLMGLFSFQTLVFEPVLKSLSNSKHQQEMQAEARRHDGSLSRFLILFLMALQLVTFVHQVELMSGQSYSFNLSPLLWVTITGTYQGWLMSAKLTVLIVLWFLHRLSGSRAQRVCLLFVSLLCLIASLSGHALEEGFYVVVLSDWLHFTSASIWIGGLIPLRRVSRKSGYWLQGREQMAFLAELMSQFSVWAILAVSMILMTGLTNASLYYFSSSLPLSEVYLHFFTMKMVLVFIALLFGVVARFYLLPLLLKNKGEKTSDFTKLETLFYRVISGELVTVLLVLMMVSLITQLALR